MTTVHHRTHHGWDRDQPPVTSVAPGAEVTVQLRDCFDGQLGPAATDVDVASLDLARANPLTGPIHVEGARPGDVLAIDILEVEVGAVGWTAIIPGFGLLADDFPDPHVLTSVVTPNRVEIASVAVLPTRPFLGTIGVAPAAPGPHAVIPPRRVGGNLDHRDVRPGARLLLPIEVDGALLSVGDPHAAQGDGEVCGTAVETTASARLRVDVLRGTWLATPQLALPAERRPPVGPRHVTMGVGPDLYAAARDATRAMIEHLARTAHLDAVDAYAVCSVAADLRITEIVDAPNWVVAMELDLDVLA